MRHLTKLALAALVLTLTQVSNVRADAIPYPTPGIENPVTYTFTAIATGDIIAYFAGSTAAFDNVLGMSVNGGPVGPLGLDNHTSALGATFDLGAVTAGDSIVFVMHNVVPGLGDLYSDPALNGPYDGGGTHNHIYSTLYTGTGPVIDTIPPGIFVSFEDLRAGGPPFGPPDWNYNDEDFVFTNVASVSGGGSVPLPSTAGCGALLLAGLLARRTLRRQPA